MNRRNFLKLFGLFAVPSSVLALPAPAPKKGNITIMTGSYDSHATFVNGESSEPYSRRKGHQKKYYRSDLGLSYLPLRVSENDVIVVRAINGVEVSFTPTWNAEHSRFASVYIDTTFKDIYDPNYKDVIKLTAVL